MAAPYLHITCDLCGQEYNGSDSFGGHCRGGPFGGCCRTFSNDQSGLKHRIGSGSERRCMTDAELLDAGWHENTRGWTHRKPMSDELKRRLQWGST